MVTPQYSPYELLDSGFDWITATTNGQVGIAAFRHLAEPIFEEETATGGIVTDSRLMGYEGRRCSGLYLGHRASDTLIITSGPRCTALAREIITNATNVSRVDVQSTVFCNGEEPHVGLDVYAHVLAERKSGHGTGEVTIRNTWPRGETCYLNSRRSDSYFRIYDKATEAKLGPERTVWRYEGEYKRKPAFQIAASALEADLKPEWFNAFLVGSLHSKGVPWRCLPAPTAISWKMAQTSRRGNTRAWLQTTVASCVRKQLRDVGLSLTLADLGLAGLVVPVTKGVRNAGH